MSLQCTFKCCAGYHIDSAFRIFTSKIQHARNGSSQKLSSLVSSTLITWKKQRQKFHTFKNHVFVKIGFRMTSSQFASSVKRQQSIFDRRPVSNRKTTTTLITEVCILVFGLFFCGLITGCVLLRFYFVFILCILCL